MDESLLRKYAPVPRDFEEQVVTVKEYRVSLVRVVRIDSELKKTISQRRQKLIGTTPGTVSELIANIDFDISF